MRNDVAASGKSAIWCQPWIVATSALSALAVAMGIGRFAFTPLLPMMQDQFGMSVAQGGWLASANYFGYLLGALSAMRAELTQRFAIRFGLLTIAVTTLAMAFADHFAVWMFLRAVPGFASAWVLVYISAWSLEHLGRAGRADLGGTVYAGVGTGIVVAGVVCLLLAQAGQPASHAWLLLGAIALAVTIWLWHFIGDGAPPGVAAVPAADDRKIPDFWRLVFCHGAFGLGYIIPATFLPVMAKEIIADPLWFGWAWPVFGAAAVISTVLASRLTSVLSLRNVWMLGNLVMAVGVLIPIVLPGLMGIAVAAVCVGGTFMVNTMVGLQEARRVAGARARILMAAMTAAFALGQIIGPLMVSSLIDTQGGFSLALIAAAVPLFLAAYTLFTSRDERLPIMPTR